MAARICATCEVDWPTDYKKCPRCLRGTLLRSARTPIAGDEARSLAAHANFRRAYARYDLGLDSPCRQGAVSEHAPVLVRKEMRERGVQSPEDLGKLEAEELAPSIQANRETIKGLEAAFQGPSADK